MVLSKRAFDSVIPYRVFVVCDQDATAPIWGYIIREKGLVAIPETSVQRAMERSMEEIPDLIVIDVNAPHAQRIELCQKFRALTASPILLFMPTNNEAEILEAFQMGVDEAESPEARSAAVTPIPYPNCRSPAGSLTSVNFQPPSLR